MWQELHPPFAQSRVCDGLVPEHPQHFTTSTEFNTRNDGMCHSPIPAELCLQGACPWTTAKALNEAATVEYLMSAKDLIFVPCPIILPICRQCHAQHLNMPPFGQHQCHVVQQQNICTGGKIVVQTNRKKAAISRPLSQVTR
jgi:hypothetical protein